jgi:hypothetical protein
MLFAVGSGMGYVAGSRPGMGSGARSVDLFDVVFSEDSCGLSCAEAIFLRRKQWPQQSFVFFSQTVLAISLRFIENSPQYTATQLICAIIPKSNRTITERVDETMMKKDNRESGLQES